MLNCRWRRPAFTRLPRRRIGSFRAAQFLTGSTPPLYIPRPLAHVSRGVVAG